MLIVFIALMAMLNSICSGTVGEWIGWGADGSFAFWGPTFASGQDLTIMANAVPLEPLETTVKIVQDTVLTGMDGTDSIAFNIMEQAVTIPQNSIVYDTLSRNAMTIEWQLIGEEVITNSAGV